MILLKNLRGTDPRTGSVFELVRLALHIILVSSFPKIKNKIKDFKAVKAFQTKESELYELIALHQNLQDQSGGNEGFYVYP